MKRIQKDNSQKLEDWIVRLQFNQLASLSADQIDDFKKRHIKGIDIYCYSSAELDLLCEHKIVNRLISETNIGVRYVVMNIVEYEKYLPYKGDENIVFREGIFCELGVYEEVKENDPQILNNLVVGLTFDQLSDLTSDQIDDFKKRHIKEIDIYCYSSAELELLCDHKKVNMLISETDIGVRCVTELSNKGQELYLLYKDNNAIKYKKIL